MITKSVSLIIPPELLKQLSFTDITVLDLIHDLCRGTSRRVPSRAFYACPSEQWLAKKVNRSREWVSNSVNKMHRLGLLDRTLRRKKGGFFQTNMYRVGALIKDGFKTYKQRLFQYLCRVKSTCHIVHKDKEREGNKVMLRTFSLNKTTRTLEDVLAASLKRLDALDKA